MDKILGLAVGGDDYVTKPFSPKEMAYRVKAGLRRAEYRQAPIQKFSMKIGELMIDTDDIQPIFAYLCSRISSTSYRCCRCNRNVLLYFRNHGAGRLKPGSMAERFTDNFSIWMENDNGKIKIEEIGLDRLDEYGLWLQVIDETGQEVLCHNKPENYPAKYSASELIALPVSTYEEGNTVFVSSYESSEETWSYLIGFPYAIGKHMLYYNGKHVGRLSPLFRMGILLIICFVLLFMVCYGFWLTRHLGRIAKGIGGYFHAFLYPAGRKGSVWPDLWGA